MNFIEFLHEYFFVTYYNFIECKKESYMAYYNGNYRAGQRQPMMTCPNQSRNRQANNCGCSQNTVTPQPRSIPADGVAQSCVMPSSCCPVAMAYIPFQAFEEPFEESKAFMVGTAFPSLLKPFLRGGRCR